MCKFSRFFTQKKGRVNDIGAATLTPPPPAFPKYHRPPSESTKVTSLTSWRHWGRWRWRWSCSPCCSSRSRCCRCRSRSGLRPSPRCRGRWTVCNGWSLHTSQSERVVELVLPPDIMWVTTDKPRRQQQQQQQQQTKTDTDTDTQTHTHTHTQTQTHTNTQTKKIRWLYPRMRGFWENVPRLRFFNFYFLGGN